MATLVGVIGAGECSPRESELAHEVGRLLAERGVGVVCGGLGGVMEAACKGCYEAGGMTVGILPGTNAQEANAFVRVAIPTGLGQARNAIVVRAASAVIAIGGEYGTLSEIGFALKMEKRVVGLDTWSIHRKGGPDGKIVIADTAEAAVRSLLE